MRDGEHVTQISERMMMERWRDLWGQHLDLGRPGARSRCSFLLGGRPHSTAPMDRLTDSRWMERMSDGRRWLRRQSCVDTGLAPLPMPTQCLARATVQYKSIYAAIGGHRYGLGTPAVHSLEERERISTLDAVALQLGRLWLAPNSNSHIHPHSHRAPTSLMGSAMISHLNRALTESECM